MTQRLLFLILAIALLVCSTACMQQVVSQPSTSPFDNSSSNNEPILTTEPTTAPTTIPTTVPTTVPSITPTEPLTAVELALGRDNAFMQLYGGIPVYSEDYQWCMEDMVLSLAEAFTTGRLGTRTAKTVIEGLVPLDVYGHKSTNDAKMQAVYDYFVFDKLVQYFTLTFDSEGNPIKCELKLAGVKAYFEDGKKCGVFKGSWDRFSLDSSIDSFEEFCSKMNVTKEVAVAFFFILESYDISWVDGDTSVLLDELFNI